MKIPGSHARLSCKPVGRWPIALSYLIGALAVAPVSRADDGVRHHTLADLIALARRANPGVAANARATEVFAAQASEAARAWLPTGEFTSLLAPSPNIECYPSARSCVRTDGPLEPTVNFKGLFTRTQLNVSQPLFTFGRLTAGIDGAEASAEASRAREQVALAQLELNVKRAYYGVKLAQAIAMSLEEALGYVKQAEDLVQKDLDEGGGEMTITDKLRLQTTRVETEAQLLEVQRGAAVAKAGLRALMGLESPSNLEIGTDPTPLPSLNTEPLSHYIEEAQRWRPDVRAMAALVRSKQKLAELEAAKRLPDLSITGSATFASATSVDNPVNAFANDPYNNRSVNLGALARIPLDLGPRLARAARAQEEYEEARALARATEAQTQLDVTTAHIELNEAQKRSDILLGAEKLSRRWLLSVVQKMNLGLAESREVTDALKAHFQTRVRYLQAVHDFNIAMAMMARGTGSRTLRP